MVCICSKCCCSVRTFWAHIWEIIPTCRAPWRGAATSPSQPWLWPTHALFPAPPLLMPALPPAVPAGGAPAVDTAPAAQVSTQISARSPVKTLRGPRPCTRFLLCNCPSRALQTAGAHWPVTIACILAAVCCGPMQLLVTSQMRAESEECQPCTALLRDEGRHWHHIMRDNFIIVSKTLHLSCAQLGVGLHKS